MKYFLSESNKDMVLDRLPGGIIATITGYCGILERYKISLLSKRINQFINDYDATYIANLAPIDKYLVFIQGMKTNNETYIKHTLNHIKCDFNDNLPIKLAIKYGNTRVGEFLLAKLAEENIDLSEIPEWIIKKFLLGDSDMDPSTNKNFAFKWAASHGYHNIVKLLLDDSRVDPAEEYNYAIRKAAKYGHLKVVELLLADPRVNPTDESNYVIRKAAKYGHLEVVELLLVDLRVDINAAGGDASHQAIKNGHMEIFKKLLYHPKFDPTFEHLYLISRVVSLGDVELLKYMLKDSRNSLANISGWDIGNIASSNIEVAKLLLEDPRLELNIFNLRIVVDNYPQLMKIMWNVEGLMEKINDIDLLIGIKRKLIKLDI